MLSALAPGSQKMVAPLPQKMVAPAACCFRGDWCECRPVSSGRWHVLLTFCLAVLCTA